MKKMWPLYNVIQLIILLVVLEIPTTANIQLILNEIKGAIELNALPKEEITKFLMGNDELKELLETGGFLALASLPIAVLLGLGVYLIKLASRKYLKCYNLL
jgi:hypothetical protein